MGLKQIIHRKQQFNKAVWNAFTIPEPPMLYSLRYPIGLRRLDLKYFKKKAFASLMKCTMPSFCPNRKHIPLVLIVRFYVPPFKFAEVPKEKIRPDNIPAVHSFELTDYLLALMEMIRTVLVDNYRTICKIEMEKYYSYKPRTEFMFMTWENYERLLHDDTIHTETKGKHKINSPWCLQPKSKRDVKAKKLRGSTDGPQEAAHWPSLCNDPLCVPCGALQQTEIPSLPPCPETGC